MGQKGTRMSQSDTITRLGVHQITAAQVAQISRGTAGVSVDAEAYRRIDAARELIDGIVARDEPAYGLTRGLGSLRDQRIPDEMQDTFQAFVYASHHAGTGALLSRTEARAVMVARFAVMARGNSGASRTLIDGLAALITSGVTPAIPEAGSVGSADLALLAAVGSVLVGHGRAITADGTLISGADALRGAGLSPVQLEAKDGHALVVANSGSVGLGCLAEEALRRVAGMYDLAAAHSIEALTFNLGVFDAEVLAARPHPGQIESGIRFRELFDGGALAAGEVTPASLQDPLAFRTLPQVHGVLLEQIQLLREVLDIELNAMPENPFIDFAGQRMVSNGNFSALRLALALDQARVALAHLGMISERRISLLIGRLRADRSLVEQLTSFERGTVPVVPPILANVAASLSSQLQYLAQPASPIAAIVGDGVEDHNSQAYAAALRLREAIAVAEQLCAIEALAAAGVASLDPAVRDRRRSTRLTRFAAQAQAALQSYEPHGGTQAQLDRLRALLGTDSEHVDPHQAAPHHASPSTLTKVTS